MKLKLFQLLNAHDVLEILGNAKGLSGTTAYRILKNIKRISEELKVYEETRKNIVEEKANKDKNGNPIIKENQYDLSSQNLKKCNQEIEKLLNEEVDIEIKKVKLSEIDAIGLSPFQIDLIEFMIDLEEKI